MSRSKEECEDCNYFDSYKDACRLEEIGILNGHCVYYEKQNVEIKILKEEIIKLKSCLNQKKDK